MIQYFYTIEVEGDGNLLPSVFACNFYGHEKFQRKVRDELVIHLMLNSNQFSQFFNSSKELHNHIKNTVDNNIKV